MANAQPRTELHTLFKTGAKPSEDDFKALIDSAINIADDAIGKPAGEGLPVKIGAQGESQNLLDFYDDDTHLWRIHHQHGENNSGLNLITGGETNSSRLFVESVSGKVGVNTADPAAQLHIQQLVAQDALRINAVNQSTLLAVDENGNMGLGRNPDGHRLSVKGSTTIAGSLSITDGSTAAFTGRVGIGTGNPNIDLAIGDDNTGLKQQGKNELAIFTNNSEKVRVSSTGNVGIGTAKPSVHLAIGDDDTGLKQQGENELAIFTNNTEKVRVSSSGKVGIGAASPTIHLAVGDNGTGLQQQGKAQLAIATGGVERVRVDSAGNVGIGTNTPKLHLAIGDDDTGLKQQGGNELAIFTGNSERVRIDSAGNVGIGTNDPKIHLAIGDSNTGFKQQGDNELAIVTANNERVRIDSSGNVGIGTNDPKIHLAIGDSDTGLKQQGDGELAVFTNNAERMRIDSAGRIGIGTNDPGKKLDINSGELRIKSSNNTGTTAIAAFYANNSTQGIGIGYNSIRALGSNANQGITLVPRGTGHVAVTGALKISQGLDVSGKLTLKGKSFSTVGYVKDGATISVPFGTVDDWGLIVTPRSMGQEEVGSEKDNALLAMQCYWSKKNSSSWTVSARYKYRVKTGDGSWRSGYANYLIVPR